MWIFTRYGFFSISVQGKHVAVRARSVEHLERLLERFWPRKKPAITVLEDADYRYRITTPKTTWANVAFDLAMEQTWSNFKDEAERFARSKYDEVLEPNDEMYVHALHEVWGIMFQLQHQLTAGAHGAQKA